jgi:hypothetical protein
MNRVFGGLVVFALAFLLFLGGAASMYFKTGVPALLIDAYQQLENATAQAGYRPERGWLFIGAKPEEIDDWNNPPVPDIEPGLKLHDASRARQGYTLYSSFYYGLPIRLIDMQGNTVHEWYLPDSFGDGSRADSVRFPPNTLPLAGDKHLYPDGRLLVNFNHSVNGILPWGFGLVMLDQDSNELWSYMKQVHHTFDVVPDGRIIAMVHEWIARPWPGLENIKPGFQHEKLAVLSPDGEELQMVSILAAIQNSPWQSILQYTETDPLYGDLLHANAVRYLDASAAAAIPNAEPGDVLVSLRDMDMLIVMDLDDETVKWATRGPWHMQHDPWVLENGNILLFDNRGDLDTGGHSRVMEFNPRNMEVTWEFPGDTGFDLYTSICGSVSRLDNGNTLITESNRGRLIEVTPEGEVVWDYYIEERVPYSLHTTTKALHARRIDPVTLEFLDAE